MATRPIRASCTMHALRIKGFAKVDVLAELAASYPRRRRARTSSPMQDDGARRVFREARALWQLTPTGRDRARSSRAGRRHRGVRSTCEQLRPAVRASSSRSNERVQGAVRRLAAPQRRSERPRRRRYDGAVDRPARQARCRGACRSSPRWATCCPRLARRTRRAWKRRAGGVVGGETNMFTGVMCGSYHDVWMELHEDLDPDPGHRPRREGSF